MTDRIEPVRVVGEREPVALVRHAEPPPEPCVRCSQPTHDADLCVDCRADLLLDGDA
ncbi:MAG TPA: hypothetical protein VF024_12160 [Solirubrobacteraceae bacterium]